MEVLIVDDDDAVRRLMTTLFKVNGLSTRTASDGLQAVELLRARTPDVIVLDLRMPRMDGRQFMAHLGKLGQRPPVIVLSAYGAEGSVKELGADDCLAKPFDPEVLVERVWALAERGGAGHPQAHT